MIQPMKLLQILIILSNILLLKIILAKAKRYTMITKMKVLQLILMKDITK